ncbi:DUF421 domain-containing protein [Microaerobacter geothermalis]|uniref:DUF421 domain-containing protein n=1 Tax=Microaerobacter geothermalis TaxID=674972 RepID=UPI001F41650D|nr:DUF421 domain-containing protein [Microaerobacter geothermalis]MCF6095313.1 DUF421 domain-containing protein [Microaerobacter geothermalis]
MPEWLNIPIRSIGMFVLLIAVTRIIGRKVASQLTFFDFVLGITIGGIAALISMNMVENLANAIIGLSVWVLLAIGLTYLTLKSKWIRDLIYGRETVLIKRGMVMEDNLKEVRYTPEDLLRQLRKKNVFELADVEFAVMESDGEINVLLKPEHKPLSSKDLNIEVASESEPQTVILDGNIMDEPLSNLGLNRQWLQTELDKIGISPENVFIGQVNSMGELYVDLFDDAWQIPKPSTRDLLMHTLKKSQADLETFALDTNDPMTKSMYSDTVKELKGIITELEPLLINK